MKSEFLDHCGYVAIIGRPNVGKSTLLNRILGQKISITTRKPQTTRHQILGIKTTAAAQVVYVDTPGIHRGSKKAMNRYMNKAAASVINDVEVVVFVVDGMRWQEDDQVILEKLKSVDAPVILALNKLDKLDDREQLLPYIQQMSEKMIFKEIIPISATKGENIESLEAMVTSLLPASPAFFPEDQVTDKSERFVAAELVREKLMMRLGQEVPYSITVEIEQFKLEKKILHINALIWVERDNQKMIVIGKNGEMLKAVGKQARLEMEDMFEKKVFLKLWVKVKDKWADDERALQNLGYTE
ncbi:GTP-binding protein Era [hydrothermal vent metagenome]|uniref:GTP-binding protein Era n=1 Tax=hydrothermal vent metagenome TaxID=652676 RepID=A0A3B0ZFW6_9ZZZZ